MTKKKSDKKISTLEASFEDVLVCKKESSKTMLEIFVEEPENISQKNLGTLAGILEITDESSDSSYIVNYLVSVLKKEYYAKTKRESIKSFEAALNKANLALTKLAEHGNINWLGKINAIIIAIERNNIHLSQAGSAKALLLRGKLLTDITDGSQNLEDPSPFKTFIDVLSGKLEKDDTFIIATNEIFEIFSFEEIKRSALKFSLPDFIRFLKTALSNELERAAALITKIEERKIVENKLIISKKSELNAFSQASYSKNHSEKPGRKILKDKEKQSLVKEIKQDLKKESAEFIDKKTGHIYIKEKYSSKESRHILENISENIQIKFTEFYNFFSKKKASLKQRIVFFKFSPKVENGEVQSKNKTQPIEKPKELIFDKERLATTLKDLFLFTKKKSLASFSFLFFLSKKILTNTKTFLPKKTDHSTKRTIPFSKDKKVGIFEKIRPRFSSLKKTFLALDYSQKIYAFLAIAFLLITPYFINKIQNKDLSEIPTPQENNSNITLPLEQDKNIFQIKKLTSVFSKDNLSKIINLNGKMYFISNEDITSAEDNQKYSFPADMGELETATNMDDLNLIFLIDSDNKILSWSPVSKKFHNNTIEIPDNSNIAFAKTYLTYIYLVDKNTNQVYRYPRANGGFGEKVNWLKETLDLNEISDIAIGENIYFAQNRNILKFFQGKKQNFFLEEKTTPILISKLYTKRNSQNLFVLDNKNSRIIKLDLKGNIISQYYNTEISSAEDFEINEESNTAYFSTGNEIKSFEMK